VCDSRDQVPFSHRARARGKARDRKILELVERFHFVDSASVARLFMRFKTGPRVAQRRLKALHDAGLLKRNREHFSDAYVYYLGKWSRNYLHWLELLDAYICTWEMYGVQLESFALEQELTIDSIGGGETLRPDAVATIDSKTLLIEIERVPRWSDYAKYAWAWRMGQLPGLVVLFLPSRRRLENRDRVPLVQGVLSGKKQALRLAVEAYEDLFRR